MKKKVRHADLDIAANRIVWQPALSHGTRSLDESWATAPGVVADGNASAG